MTQTTEDGIEQVEAAEGLPEITGPMLRAIRQKLNMGVGEFGEAIGVYAGTLTRWENEQQPMANPRMVRLAVLGYLSQSVISRVRWVPFVRSTERLVAAEEEAKDALTNARLELLKLERAASALSIARARLIAQGEAASALASIKEAAKMAGADLG